MGSSTERDLPIFLGLLKTARLAAPEREYRFHPTRKWRFDLAWPDRKVALEIDGGVWTGGRHTRGSGFIRDQEKTNEAAVLGWRVLRITPSQLKQQDTIRLIQRVFDGA